MDGFFEGVIIHSDWLKTGSWRIALASDPARDILNPFNGTSHA
ncbi:MULTISPECIES: hypothetical protein [unclassified Pseudomonas]|nr:MULTISPECIES: hypothetical protein [unclassified Pseudomonas]